MYYYFLIHAMLSVRSKKRRFPPVDCVMFVSNSVQHFLFYSFEKRNCTREIEGDVSNAALAFCGEKKCRKIQLNDLSRLKFIVDVFFFFFPLLIFDTYTHLRSGKNFYFTSTVNLFQFSVQRNSHFHICQGKDVFQSKSN